MATEAIKGDSSFTYTPVGGSETVHTLAVPLIISPEYGFGRAKRRRRWEAWSSDGRTRAVFVLADGSDEITAQIRFDNEPASLITMLEEALYNDVTLTYSPDGEDDYPCKLVEIVGAGPDEVRIEQDRARFTHGEWMVTVVLRRVDGGTFDALLPDAA